MTLGRNVQNTPCFSFRVGLLFVNFSSFKPDTENKANFENYASHCQHGTIQQSRREESIVNVSESEF